MDNDKFLDAALNIDVGVRLAVIAIAAVVNEKQGRAIFRAMVEDFTKEYDEDEDVIKSKIAVYRDAFLQANEAFVLMERPSWRQEHAEKLDPVDEE